MRRACTQLTTLVVNGIHQRPFHLTARYMMATSNSPRPNTLVGVVQMTATPDKEANFEVSKGLIESAAHRGAKVCKPKILYISREIVCTMIYLLLTVFMRYLSML